MSIKKVKAGYKVEVYLGMVNGKKVRAYGTFDKFSEAKDFEARQVNFKNNVSDPTVSKKTVFGEVAKRYIEECGLSDNTIISYQSKFKVWIEPHLGHVQIGNITAITITRFFHKIKQLEKPASPSTEFLIKTVLDNIFNYACNSIERYIQENPMTHIPEMKLEQRGFEPSDYWNKKEATAFLKEAAKTPYYNVFVFMLNTGARIAEVSGITKDSFDLDSSSLNIKQQISNYSAKINEEKFSESAHILSSTKSYKQRTVPLNDMAISAIKSELDTGKGNYFLFAPGKTEEKLVVIKRGHKCQTIRAKHITQKTIYLIMKRICTSAGIKFIGPHGCRHTFSANFLMNGGDIYTLSRLLGHKSVQTTIDHYGHLSKEFKASAAKIVSFGEEL